MVLLLEELDTLDTLTLELLSAIELTELLLTEVTLEEEDDVAVPEQTSPVIVGTSAEPPFLST